MPNHKSPRQSQAPRPRKKIDIPTIGIACLFSVFTGAMGAYVLFGKENQNNVQRLNAVVGVSKLSNKNISSLVEEIDAVSEVSTVANKLYDYVGFDEDEYDTQYEITNSTYNVFDKFKDLESKKSNIITPICNVISGTPFRVSDTNQWANYPDLVCDFTPNDDEQTIMISYALGGIDRSESSFMATRVIIQYKNNQLEEIHGLRSVQTGNRAVNSGTWVGKVQSDIKRIFVQYRGDTDAKQGFTSQHTKAEPNLGNLSDIIVSHMQILSIKN